MLDYNQDQNQVTPAPSVLPATANTVSVEQVVAFKPKRKWWLYGVLVVVLVLLGSGGWWYYAKGQVLLLAKNMTWQLDGNYKMKQVIDLKLDNIKTTESSSFNFTNVGLKFDSFMDVVGQNLEGQADLRFSSNKENTNFILKYKKIDKTVYLGIDSQDEWLKMIPFDLNSTWISIDQESLQANPLLQGKPNDYLPAFKDWSQKNNVFLQNIKDKKLIILSDPHETKEVASVKLKKMDFDINPDKINEFLLTSIDAFADPSAAIEMKKNFETYKTSKADNWSNMQTLIKSMTFSFWVDAKSKNIVGMDFTLNNFDFKNKNGHLLNLTVNFSQTIENIEAKEITKPENVMTLDELQTALIYGANSNINNWQSVDSFGAFTTEQLSELRIGVSTTIQTCLQAGKKLNAPGHNIKICEKEGILNWPDLPNGYQWSNDFSFDGMFYEICFYSPNVSGVLCTQDNCLLTACRENLDSDNDGLSDDDEERYKTNLADSDSDNDGYLDGDEVKNGYNPLGAGKL